jgi:alanine dehydrogenase
LRSRRCRNRRPARPQIGAHFLEKQAAAAAFAGAPGVPPADVLFLGAGSVGAQATAIALGMGASVLVADRTPDALRRLETRFGFAARTIYSTRAAIAESVKRADLVICAALAPGAKAPILITRDMLSTMKRGAVIVDVAIDQGGCCETSRPTSHSDPTYVVDGVVHYCVTNMPGVTPRTATFALNNAIAFVPALANKGWRRAIEDDPHLRAGLEISAGRILSPPVAAAHGLLLSPQLGAEAPEPHRTASRRDREVLATFRQIVRYRSRASFALHCNNTSLSREASCCGGAAELFIRRNC